MDKDTKRTRKEQYVINRKGLIELSKVIRMGVKEGIYDSVNEGLKEAYTGDNPEILEFKTFSQWKEDGYTIKKGSKAFILWGQPRKVSQVPEGSSEPEEYKYWPLCYLFADTQVFKREKEQGKEEIEPRRQPQEVENLEEAFI